MPPEFRQRRYFYYLTGAEDADCYVTYDIRSDRLCLWVPAQRNDRQILYMGPVITPDSALKLYDIDKASYAAGLDSYVDGYLKTGSTIYLLHRGDYRAIQAGQSECLDGSAPSIDFSSLKRAMDACRVIKDEWEVSAIRQANRLTALAHVEVLKNISKLSNEAGVEGVYTGTCIAAGAKSQAYFPICGAGENAATLHYTANNSPIQSQQMLLIDAGVEYKCYASDVTRTFPVSPSDLGYPSAEAEAIYSLVDRMQSECIAKVRPGVLFRDINILAHFLAVDGLLRLGILHNGILDEIMAAGTSSAFFPHGLGHHLGLEVHDVEDSDQPMIRKLEDDVRPFETASTSGHPSAWPSAIDQHCSSTISQDEINDRYGHLLANEDTHKSLCTKTTGLRAGMVVTIEPGIYFNKFGLDKIYLKDPKHSKFINVDVLKKYMSVGGVRIEDDILVSLQAVVPAILWLIT